MGKSDRKLRQQIAFEAARLLVTGSETSLQEARERASRRVTRGAVRPRDLPGAREIHHHLESLALQREAPASERRRRAARLEVLTIMRRLRRFAPRFLDAGAEGGRIMLESAELEPALDRLESMGFACELHTAGQARVSGRSSVILELAPRVPGALGIAELEEDLARDYPWCNFEDAAHDDENPLDHEQHLELLLRPLEDVKLDPRQHPEGSALYHSLQVFDLCCRELPYDLDCAMAALLHMVGHAIDPPHATEAAIDALDGSVSERTALLIRYLPHACAELRGELGGRARRRFLELEDREELSSLARCDLRGRVSGADAPTLAAALAYLRELSAYGSGQE